MKTQAWFKTMRFGWLPEKHEYQTSTLRICPIPEPEFETSLSAVSESGQVAGDWYYPIQSSASARAVQCASRGIVARLRALGRYRDANDLRADIHKPGSATPPPWFALPASHEIEGKTSVPPPDLLEFVVTVLGWSKGLRLIPEGWGHHKRVAAKIGQLTDFHVSKLNTEKLLSLAESFWHRHHRSGVASKLFSAVHWYLYAFSYHQEFERFMNQYMVLDACFRTYWEMTGSTVSPRGGHSCRASFLCNELGIPCPSWAQTIPSTGRRVVTQLSEMRNELIHEARWGGKPIGFGGPPSSVKIVVELEALNCRFIAGILGVKGSYIASSCQTRSRHSLEL